MFASAVAVPLARRAVKWLIREAVEELCREKEEALRKELEDRFFKLDIGRKDEAASGE